MQTLISSEDKGLWLILVDYICILGPGVAQWLRRCATSQTVPASIPGGVTGFFSDIFLPTVPWPWGQLSP
jgi:hypothetical protein